MRLRLGMTAVLFLASVAAAKDVTVKVGHKGFEPSTVTIEKGDTIVFSNTQEMPGGHTIVADDDSFSSPALAKDKSWSRTFAKQGSYRVHLKEHPEAKGEIVVR